MKVLSRVSPRVLPTILGGCFCIGLLPAMDAQDVGGTRAVASPPVLATDPVPADGALGIESQPQVHPDAPATETEILATNGATFSAQDRVAVFEGDVRVNDPRFQLACDRLTVFLAKSAVTGGKEGAGSGGVTAPAVLAPASPPKAGSSPGNTNGIDHASADGHVIIIQKRAPTKPGEEAKISIGRAEKADFDNRTGDMVLRGTPSVEQNGNTLVALLPSTVMTLHRDNSMTVSGPSRTVIKQRRADASDLPGSAPAGDTAGRPGGKPHGRPAGGT